jgi:hypothetical protein
MAKIPTCNHAEAFTAAIEVLRQFHAEEYSQDRIDNVKQYIYDQAAQEDECPGTVAFDIITEIAEQMAIENACAPVMGLVN